MTFDLKKENTKQPYLQIQPTSVKIDEEKDKDSINYNKKEMEEFIEETFVKYVQIANKNGLSPNSVDNYNNNIKKKNENEPENPLKVIHVNKIIESNEFQNKFQPNIKKPGLIECTKGTKEQKVQKQFNIKKVSVEHQKQQLYQVNKSLISEAVAEEDKKLKDEKKLYITRMSRENKDQQDFQAINLSTCNKVPAEILEHTKQNAENHLNIKIFSRENQMKKEEEVLDDLVNLRIMGCIALNIGREKMNKK